MSPEKGNTRCQAGKVSMLFHLCFKVIYSNSKLKQLTVNKVEDRNEIKDYI